MEPLEKLHFTVGMCEVITLYGSSGWGSIERLGCVDSTRGGYPERESAMPGTRHGVSAVLPGRPGHTGTNAQPHVCLQL